MSRDSDIEQQLAQDEQLFALMSDGAVDDEEYGLVNKKEEEPVQKEEVQQVAEEEPVVEESTPVRETVEDSPMEEHAEEVEEEYEELVEDDTNETDTTSREPEVQLYTPEEIKQILANGDFSQVDTSRLSEEGKLVMKSMQSGLTPKLQEAAELRKKLEGIEQKLEEAIPKAPPKDIYEAYDRDPKGVMSFVEQKIDEAIDSGDEIAEKKLTLTWNRLKEHARDQALRPKAETNSQPSEQIPVTMANLLRAIPDIETKQQALKDYALNVMGYSEQELAEATSLERGDAGVREIVRINNAYEKFVAPKKAQAKAKRKSPTKVEKSGGGFDKQDTTSNDRVKEAYRRAANGDSNAFFDVFYHMED